MGNVLADLINSQKKSNVPFVAEKTVKAHTQVSVRSNGEEREVKDEVVEVEKKFFTQKPTYVSVEYGGNINMGDYNMAKVKVSISYPVGQEITPEQRQKIEDGYAFCQGFVEQKFKEEVERLKR